MYSVLQDSSSSDDEKIEVPDYEDLSSNRADEVTVLRAVYGTDFAVDKEGLWTVRAFDDKRQHELLLQVKPNKRYPYVAPKISIGHSKLRESEENALMEQLTTRANELAKLGSVMIIELVQVRRVFWSQKISCS